MGAPPPPLPLPPPPPPPPPPPQQQKRKKWTEEEERCLIDKYSEMQSNGSLHRLRTREKRFRPIAVAVNAAHHHLDSAAYPFSWTWKDASTKVQNMRHQYLLVKQKIISSSADADAIDWSDGLSLWPNFLRYKSVFGDAPLPDKLSSSVKPSASDANPLPASVDDGDLGLGLGFDCVGFDYEEPSPNLPLDETEVILSNNKRKKRDKKVWAKLVSQLERICDRQLQMDNRETERESKRIREEEAVEERRRAAAEEEREWEENMELRRTEWRRRMESMEDMLARHREEMEQLTARVIHEQQAVVGQLVSIVGQWATQGIGGSLGDAGCMNQQPNQAYHFSQMMQGLHHVNAMLPEENRIGGDSQEDDEFIVDD